MLWLCVSILLTEIIMLVKEWVKQRAASGPEGHLVSMGGCIQDNLDQQRTESFNSGESFHQLTKTKV